MAETDEVNPRTQAEQASAISALLVQSCVESLGRGPTRARTTIATDVITVILDDGLTRAEKTLVNAGHAKEVLAARRAFQRVMAPELITGVERITGRQVHALLSDNHIDPDVAAEVFVLRPAGTEVAPEDVAPTSARAPSR